MELSKLNWKLKIYWHNYSCRFSLWLTHWIFFPSDYEISVLKNILIHILYAVHTRALEKKSCAKFRCGQRWREPNDVGVGKFLFPCPLVLRDRRQHRNLAHSDIAFFTMCRSNPALAVQYGSVPLFARITCSGTVSLWKYFESEPCTDKHRLHDISHSAKTVAVDYTEFAIRAENRGYTYTCCFTYNIY